MCTYLILQIFIFFVFFDLLHVFRPVDIIPKLLLFLVKVSMKTIFTLILLLLLILLNFLMEQLVLSMSILPMINVNLMMYKPLI